MASATGDTTGPLLAQEKIDRYRPLGVFGKPAYQSHVQLRALLMSKRGAKFANYFAKPSYDADTGELRWTAEVPGEARGWNTLSPEEQANRALDLEVIRSGLASYAQELRAQAGPQSSGSQGFASLLDQALKVPAQGEFLYFVGEQPVIAFWGFETQAGASVDAAATAPQFASGARPIHVATSAAPLQTQGETRTGTSGIAGPVGTAAVAALPPEARPWWRWLLWGLMALALLLALLWLLRACTTNLSIDGAVPPTDKPLLEGSVGGPGAPRSPGVHEGALGGDVPGGSSAQGPGGPDTTAQSDGPPRSDTAPPPEEPAGPADPQVPSDGKPPPDALADRSDSKGATDPPLPKDGSPLDLPPDDGKGAKGAKGAQGMGFLAGRWKAGEGLADRNTREPLDLSFQFDKAGKGEVTLRRPDGSTCKGSVEGAMSGGKLSIQGNQAIPCSGGGSYAAPRIECAKDRAGQTQCFGVNNDGSKYYMGMQRQDAR